MEKGGDEGESTTKNKHKDSLQMVNNAADNEGPSSLQRRARSMSMYGSQMLKTVNNPHNSLFCLDEGNPIRKISKFIVESKRFEHFILLAIAANCIVLALNTPLPNDDKTDMSGKLEDAELCFVVIFCIEASLKILALGFVLHPGAYLRNGWNILDFVVVVVGILSLPQLEINSLDVKALRAVRVLRPLKLISGVPSLQVVMKSIMRAMVPLLQIALLVLFCIVIYAIIGLEFLRKNFHYTCANETGLVDPSDAIRPCDPPPHPGVRKIFHGRVCDAPANCSYVWKGPNDGITTFDNIFLSALTVFQCITMEGWTHIMYLTFDAIDKTRCLYSIYYVSLIVIGSFFVLNLVLGVLSGEFAKERERVETRRSFFKIRRQQQIERQVDGYTEWIAKAEELIVEEADVRDRDSKSNLVPNSATLMNVSNRQETSSDQTNISDRKESFLNQEKKLRLKIGRMVKHKAFYWIVIVCVFLNTITVATEHYEQPEILGDFQDTAELVFLTIFFAEMILKMYGLGLTAYFRSSFNCFDCVVVCSGIVNYILYKTVDINMGVSVLRCVRLLRMFKVTRHWKSLRNLATSLVSSIKSIVSLIFLLFLFILIAALLGMQLFGGRFRDEVEEPPRTNFDNFQNAMLAVFQILTGEDWNSVMYNGVKAYGGPQKPEGLAVSLYFVLLVILGNYTLLNVFLAIAVDNLANAQILTEDEETERIQHERHMLEDKEKFSAGTGKGAEKWRGLPVVLALNQFMKKKNGDVVQPDITGDQANSEGRSNQNGEQRPPMSQSLTRKINRYRQEDSRYGYRTDAEQPKPADGEEVLEPRRRIGRRIRDPEKPEPEQRNEEEDDGNPRITAKNFVKVLKGGRFGNHRRHVRSTALVLRTKTLFLFGPENRLRRLCHRIVNLRHFDNFMLVIIVLSSITIAVEDPVNDNSERNQILRYFDYAFTGIFLLEVLLKIVDIGVILHKGAYLRSWWNVIDALVVVCNTASLILTLTSASGKGQSTVKALRVFRVLRPFKSIHKIKKLQSVFRCMWFSVKNVANILMITVLFLFIFAVMGVQLFSGKFFYCTDASKLTKEDCQGQYFVFEYDSKGKQDTTPKVETREWKNRPLNFDNVFMAMLTLYTSSTGEGWPAAMHATMDTTEKDQGPIQNNSTPYAIYYISFVVVFSFFFLNIFVALIILTFQEEGEREIANCELDRNQRDCIQFALRSKPAQRYMPKNTHGLRYKVWVVALSKPFDIFIMVLIALNTLVLMMQYYGQSEYYGEIISNCNIAFTAVFALEAVLKLIALGLNYFRDYWNIFDFVIVLGGLMDIIASKYQEEGDFLGGIDPSMFRLFRAARLIKLLRQGYTIRILLWTFLQSFKALPYVTLLILLMFFMYSVIGMQLFGKIAIDENTEINHNNNFRNFVEGLQVLFRSATGEDWHKIMLACFDSAGCDKQVAQEYGTCGTTAGAIIYFCSFIFICMFLMLNLFVAVIMDNFEYLTRDESILGPHHLDEFVRVWSEYDPAATGSIHHSKIYMMMCSMTPPVGFGKKCPKIVGYKRLIKMNMPLNDGETVTFCTTLFALVRTSLNIKLRGNMNANDTELRKMIIRVWPNTSNKVLDKLIPKESVLSSQQMTIGKIYCAKLIHENYKHLKRKKLNQSQFRREEEVNTSSHKRGLLRRIMGSIRRKKNTTRYSYTDGSIPLDSLDVRRARSNTSDGRLTTRRNSLEYAYPGGQLQRYRSLSPKENGRLQTDKNGPQANSGLHQPGGSSAEPPVLPATYLTPSPRNDVRITPQGAGSQYLADGGKRGKTNSQEDEYYDEMIGRINRELAIAVAKGRSPYQIYALEEDDEDDWC